MIGIHDNSIRIHGYVEYAGRQSNCPLGDCRKNHMLEVGGDEARLIGGDGEDTPI